MSDRTSGSSVAASALLASGAFKSRRHGNRRRSWMTTSTNSNNGTKPLLSSPETLSAVRMKHTIITPETEKKKKRGGNKNKNARQSHSQQRAWKARLEAGHGTPAEGSSEVIHSNVKFPQDSNNSANPTESESSVDHLHTFEDTFDDLHPPNHSISTNPFDNDDIPMEQHPDSRDVSADSREGNHEQSTSTSTITNPFDDSGISEEIDEKQASLPTTPTSAKNNSCSDSQATVSTQSISMTTASHATGNLAAVKTIGAANPTNATKRSSSRSGKPPTGLNTSTLSTNSVSGSVSLALDFSANACTCLEQENLAGALHWYQRALLVYQTTSQELSIVDTCNAAATLHNMGAVYNVLQQPDNALQCYHDAEQLYRECHERLQAVEVEDSRENVSTPPSSRRQLYSKEQLQDQEAVCLTALVADTLHHRATIYESSVWDSVAALECHEACVELLSNGKDETGVEPPQDDQVWVTNVDDVYFQHTLPVQDRLQLLTSSYEALAKFYRNSDTPQDSLDALQSWQSLLENHLATNKDSKSAQRWRKSLGECYKQLSDYYFSQQEMSLGVDALHQAMETQLQAKELSTSPNASDASMLSQDVLEKMNSMGLRQEEEGDYDQALACYEKKLLLVSRYLGDDHWEVAETLVKIGHVMELQGNVAGGLDLYHAAHTIYQAAVRNDKESTVGSSAKSEASTDLLDDYDLALSTRAATESVVRIANVLMSQKRWQEAVDFLRELPQAKEWLSWLGDDNSTPNGVEGDTREAVSYRVAQSTKPTNASPPTVDQAIVFRELGRAYMGMGALVKAKQCLLESARRLEGTEHEEDVFELLMHVEFCQKQERITALAKGRRRRSRSRSRSRRGRHSRSNSAGSTFSFDSKGRISKDVVAAVIASSSHASISVPPTLGQSQSSNLTALSQVAPSGSRNNDNRALSTTDYSRSVSSNNTKTSKSQNDETFESNHVQNSSSSDSGEPPSPPDERVMSLSADKEQGDIQSHGSSDSKSLGSLGTKSTGSGKKQGMESRPASIGQNEFVSAPHQLLFVEADSVDFKDSVQVQQAKDILLKRGNKNIQDSRSTVIGQSPNRLGQGTESHIDDEATQSDAISSVLYGSQSDVVSSILHGLAIEGIDLPPSSPSTDERSECAPLLTAKSSCSDRPFDEPSAFSNDSSQSHQLLKLESSTSNLSAQEKSKVYPSNVLEQVMPTRFDESYRVDGQGTSGSISSLTPTLGPSFSSSVTDSSPVIKASPLQPLLDENEESQDEDLNADDPLLSIPSTNGPKENRLEPQSELIENAFSASPFVDRTTSEDDELDKIRQNHPNRAATATVLLDTSCHDTKSDDGSSDPFEGYEDFDEDDETEANESPSYSGESEAEEGYTRFQKEDLSTTDEDVGSVGSDDSERRRSRNHFPDQGMATQANFGGKIFFPGSTSISRQSPDLSAHSENLLSFSKIEDSKQNTSHSFEARSAEPQINQPPAPDVKTEIPPSETNSSGKNRDSTGNKIVQALSNSIRRRRKNKQSGKSGPASLQSQEKEDNLNASSARNSPAVNSTFKLPGAEFIDIEEDDNGSVVGPIQFVSMSSPSYDDAMSQITFVQDEGIIKNGKNKSGQWWGQFGRLDGWFPNSYFNQAVEAAEGFLSAKTIHAQVRSQPLDFDVVEEEEDDEIVRKPSTNMPEVDIDRSNSASQSMNDNNKLMSFSSSREKSDNNPVSKSVEIQDAPDNSPVEAKGFSLAAMATPSRDERTGNRLSQTRSKLELEIEKNETLLEQYEEDALNDDETANRMVAATLFRLSILYIQSGKMDEALEATNDALRIQKSLGDSQDAAKSLHLLADIFVRKDEFESALSCYAEVQEMELEMYGFVHEETAKTLNRIGSVLARQSKFGAAMEKHQEALRILKECYGEELHHPLVSQTLIHIGAVYYRERNSLATARAKVDGYSTFIEVGMLEVIGRAHEDRGSYKMAISFFEEKLQFLNQRKKDPTTKEGVRDLKDVATTLNSLGMLSCRAGIFMEAIDYYDRALEIQKEIGCDKMHVATARVLTAAVQYHLGYFNKALRLLKEALGELQNETGRDHETVAATWFQIGVCRVALCEYDDGMDALEEALRIQNKLLGKLHPATLRTRREIGNMYAIYESELDAAFAQFHDILATQRRIHGPKHPNVAETLHSLGCAYARKGDYSNAIKTLEECYYTRIEFLGSDHPMQASTLHEIAQIHMKRQRYRKAIHICNAVLEIRKESLNERHIDVARALATKASSLVAIGSYDEARTCLMEALPMAEQSVGPRHPAVADIYVHIAGMHLRKCHFDAAKEWIEKAFDIYQNSNLDEDHPSFKEARALIERVDRDEMLCV